MGTAGGLHDIGLIVPEPPDMERDRSLGWSYSSIDMERMRRGIRVTWCIGTADTENTIINRKGRKNLFQQEERIYKGTFFYSKHSCGVV